jgi:hypothetical protein
VRAANDVLRFCLEIGMLVSLSFAGFALAGGALSWVLGIGLPLVAATIWGLWMAPKAAHRVRDPAQLSIELLLFGGAAVLLAAAGHAALGIVLGALAAIHLALTFPLGQRVA